MVYAHARTHRRWGSRRAVDVGTLGGRIDLMERKGRRSGRKGGQRSKETREIA